MEAPGTDRRSVGERLKAATEELQKLEKLVLSGDCAARVLCDFRDAVDSIRQTAWAVQQWSELREQQRDPYKILDLLSEDRVRRCTQIMKDLTTDLESLELGLDTPGLEKLSQTVSRLHERLTPLFKKDLAEQ
jgi:hypothetical protein